MKRIPAIIFAAAAVLLSGCNKGITISEEPGTGYGNGAAFTLTATAEGTPDTKLGFDSDGLGMTWQPGDKLYLVDIAGVNKTVTLTTNITTPSKTASFSSSESVLTGNYLVLYGQNTLSLTYNYSMTDLSKLQSRIRLYGSLSVADGQTSGSISLSHVFARLSFKFRNIPSGLTNMSFGMAATSVGLPIASSGKITKDGLAFTSDYRVSQSFSWNNGADSYVLIPPMNLSSQKVIFFLYGTNANGDHVTYEIHKNGINLRVGVNYNIILDFSSSAAPSVLTLTGSYYGLSSPKDFRAAAVWEDRYYVVLNDVDFTDEVYLPISTGGLHGNNHILKNVTVDFEECSSVGIVSSGYASELVVKNASINGKSNVGGVVGSGRASKCGYEGTVMGKSYVGGIVGVFSSGSDIQECYAVANVSGSSYVGGIAGKDNSSSKIMNSYFIGSVTGFNYVAGICGYGVVNCCYSYCTSVSSGNGISSTNGYSESNLTSLSKQFPSGSLADNCNCGPDKTFLSKLNAINKDEAFSTQVWQNIDAGCPLLQWQAKAFGGDISAPGFGDENW